MFRIIIKLLKTVYFLFGFCGDRIRRFYLLAVAHDLYRASVALDITNNAISAAIKWDKRKSQRIDELTKQLGKLKLPQNEIQRRILALIDSELPTINTINLIIQELQRYKLT